MTVLYLEELKPTCMVKSLAATGTEHGRSRFKACLGLGYSLVMHSRGRYAWTDTVLLLQEATCHVVEQTGYIMSFQTTFFNC